MSKADEKFEKLGYEKVDYGYKIEYIKKDKREDFIIEIMLESKLIFTEIDDGFNEIERRSFGIKIEELQAINEKCKELGWIESEV